MNNMSPEDRNKAQDKSYGDYLEKREKQIEDSLNTVLGVRKQRIFGTIISAIFMVLCIVGILVIIFEIIR